MALKSAKSLARRLGLSYAELSSVVSTAFVNPRLDALVLLRRISLDLADVLRYKAAPNYPALSADVGTEARVPVPTSGLKRLASPAVGTEAGSQSRRRD